MPVRHDYTLREFLTTKWVLKSPDDTHWLVLGPGSGGLGCLVWKLAKIKTVLTV